MSTSKKKMSLQKLLKSNTKQLPFQVISGEEMETSDDESPEPFIKLVVKCIDEDEDTLFEKVLTYGIISPKAIESLESKVENMKDENDTIMLPYPKNFTRSKINWVNTAF